MTHQCVQMSRQWTQWFVSVYSAASWYPTLHLSLLSDELRGVIHISAVTLLFLSPDVTLSPLMIARGGGTLLTGASNTSHTGVCDVATARMHRCDSDPQETLDIIRSWGCITCESLVDLIWLVVVTVKKRDILGTNWLRSSCDVWWNVKWRCNNELRNQP